MFRWLLLAGLSLHKTCSRSANTFNCAHFARESGKSKMHKIELGISFLTINDKRKKWNELNNIMVHFYDNEKVNRKTMEMVEECAEDLERVIHQKYPYLDLKEYGSLATGFGNKDSDIDFSLIFKKREKKEMMDHVVLKSVADAVSKVQATWDVAFIDAKVPLAQFNWKGLEVDISYLNKPALDNTEILQQYCKWEPHRLRILGFWVKKWAKAFDICSKKNGTLSSYTYILLMIHFLQRHKPHVLPCLHSDFWDKTIKKTKEDKKTYYHKDVEAHWSQNTETAAELFIGFLEFYANFKFGKNLIHIRSRVGNIRSRKEFGAPIVVRDVVQKKVNIASHVTQSTMDEIVDIIRTTLSELDNWLDGEPVGDKRIRDLFNIQ